MIATLTVNSLLTGDGTNYTILDANGFGSPVVDVARAPHGGRHGISVPRALWRERRPVLLYGLRAATKAEYAALREALIQAFDLPRNGNSLITLTTTDGKSLQMTSNIRNAMDAGFKPGFITAGKIRIELINPDPNIFGQTLNEDTVSPPVAGGTEIPTAIPLALASSGGSVTANNMGNGVFFPTVRISGPCINPHVRNSTLEQEFIINTTIAAGAFVDVDLDAQTALLNGVTNYLNNFSGDWWWLKPGNNVINFSSDGNNPAASMRVQWRAAYVGI